MPLPDLNSIPSSGDKPKDNNDFEEIQYEDLDGLEEITDESLEDDSVTISDYNDLNDLEEITDENLEEDNDLVGLDDFPEISLDDIEEDDDEEVSLSEQEIEDDEEIDEDPMFSMGKGLASKLKFKKKEKKEKTKKEKPLFNKKEQKQKSKSGFNLFKILKTILMLLIGVVVVVLVLKFLGNRNSNNVTDNTEVSQDSQIGAEESVSSGGLEIKNRTIQDNSYYLLIKSANPVTPKFVESAFLTESGIIKCIAFSPQIESGDNTVLLDDCDGDIYDGMEIQKAIDNIKIQ